MKHLLTFAAITLSIPANAGGLDNPWKRPTVTPDGTAATLNQSNRMDLCDIRARLEGWTRREIDRCESGGSDHGGGVSPSFREQGDGGTPAPSPDTEGERVIGEGVVDKGNNPVPEEREVFQTKEEYFGGRQNFGNWTDKQRDFHKTGNPNWAECDCPKVAE